MANYIEFQRTPYALFACGCFRNETPSVKISCILRISYDMDAELHSPGNRSLDIFQLAE